MCPLTWGPSSVGTDRICLHTRREAWSRKQSARLSALALRLFARQWAQALVWEVAGLSTFGEPVILSRPEGGSSSQVSNALGICFSEALLSRAASLSPSGRHPAFADYETASVLFSEICWLNHPHRPLLLSWDGTERALEAGQASEGQHRILGKPWDSS